MCQERKGIIRKTEQSDENPSKEALGDQKSQTE